MKMYNFLMMLWKAVFSLQSNVGKDTFDFIASEVFSLLPKSFLAILMLMFVIYFGDQSKSPLSGVPLGTPPWMLLVSPIVFVLH